MNQKHILIVGAGSVGKRHARNLVDLGCRISCVDPRPDRLDETRQEISLLGAYNDLDEALAAADQIDGVAVTSPPLFHVDQCVVGLEHGIPVLLEKPVSPDEASATRLREVVQRTGVPLLLGYTYRWWEPLKRVRELLAQGCVGKLRHVKFVMAAHLADWHPWERYQDFFMASKRLGGGAILDESHWIDLMLWFFGMPQKLFAQIEKISDLEIDTDDNVDIFVHYANKLRVTIHLDLFGRPHEKYIRFVGEDGTMLWSLDPNCIAIGREGSQTWQTTTFQYERNDMFEAVAREFIEVLNGGAVRTCTIEDGVRVLSVIEAARRSQADGCLIDLPIAR